MKVVFVLSVLIGCGAAQLTGTGGVMQGIRDWLDQHNTNDDTIDTIHGWRLEDHLTPDDHILLFINDRPEELYCYVIHVGRRWEGLLDTQENVYRISEEIYAMVAGHTHDTQPLRPGDLADDYHDFDAARECSGHKVYAVSYTPSFA